MVTIFGESVLGDRIIIEIAVVGACFVTLALCCSPVRFLLETKALQKCGQLSLYLYLVHCPVYVCVNLINYFVGGKIDFNSKIVFAVILSVTVLISISAKRIDDRVQARILHIQRLRR